jgi:hypothetical protein
MVTIVRNWNKWRSVSRRCATVNFLLVLVSLQTHQCLPKLEYRGTFVNWFNFPLHHCEFSQVVRNQSGLYRRKLHSECNRNHRRELTPDVSFLPDPSLRQSLFHFYSSIPADVYGAAWTKHRVRLVESLVHNEPMTATKALRNSERHLSQLTISHCPHDTETVELCHCVTVQMPIACCFAVRNRGIGRRQ